MGKIYEALELGRKEREAQTGLPALPHPAGIAPAPGGAASGIVAPQDLWVVSEPDSLMAECFRFLRSKIIRPAGGKPPRTILVTSALTGEGKTFVAANLASAICQGIEESVLLLDADLRKSTLHEFFGMAYPRHGLSTYLSGQARIPELLRKTTIEKLTVLPAGNSTDIPAELLSSEKMKMLLREVRDRYPDRFVVIDSPPVELTPETAVIANEVDGIVFVVRYGMTPRNAVKSALSKLSREKLLGLVFNGYNKPLKFYDQYGYHKYGYKKRKPQTDPAKQYL